jgi:putative DNA primase/helicase
LANPVVPLFAPPPPAPHDKDSVDFMVVDLARSGLVPEDLNCYPISSKKFGEPAYVLPYNDNSNLYRIRIARDKDKYISTTGISPDIWIPPSTCLEGMFDGDLYIVEGEKKAAAVFKYWKLPNVVGIGGCWNAVRTIEASGAYKLIDRLHLLITPGRKIKVILDSDVIENEHVGRAAGALNSCIEACGSIMELYIPPTGCGDKGVDDFIYHNLDQLDSALSRLELVPLDKLAINRSLLYKQLECHLSTTGMLILNELNGSKLLNYHFRAIGVINDKRLGFIDSSQKVISPVTLAAEALHYLQGDISPRYSASAINGAFTDYIAGTEQKDLVQDMVKNRLNWDGVDRLDSWGSEYFDTDLPKLANEWGRLLITGMVMRILEPGSKVDTVLILNGKQGIGKTTFFEDLATIDKYNFYREITEIPGSTGDDRTFKQTITAALVVDLGEGIIFESRKTSSDKLKQFITSRYDEYRVAYAKANTVTPRGYIFVGTTNRSDQLTDYTGSRRFLYLNVTKITRLPYEIKLQLMAEVVAKFEAIKNSDWYTLRLTLEDLPQKLRDENQHITQVNELLNVEHYRSDTLTEIILALIENNIPSRLKSGEMVLVKQLIAQHSGQMSSISLSNAIGRKLSELNSSPQFPYAIKQDRKRIPQMDFKQGHKELYTGHINNDQGQFPCFIVRKK